MFYILEDIEMEQVIRVKVRYTLDHLLVLYCDP